MAKTNRRHSQATLRPFSLRRSMRWRRLVQIAAGAGILGMLFLAAASLAETTTPTPPTAVASPSAQATPNIAAIQASAIKAIDSTMKSKGAGISWQATTLVPGTYGQFVPTAPKADSQVPVFEITLSATAKSRACPTCTLKTYHATEKAVVAQSNYQTLWVSGTKSPI